MLFKYKRKISQKFDQLVNKMSQKEEKHHFLRNDNQANYPAKKVKEVFTKKNLISVKCRNKVFLPDIKVENEQLFKCDDISLLF